MKFTFFFDKYHNRGKTVQRLTTLMAAEAPVLEFDLTYKY